MEVSVMQRTFKNYKEDAPRKVVVSKMEALASEFTAQEDSVISKGNLSGRRYTILAPDKSYTITCVGLEKQAADNGPVFSGWSRA